MRHFNEIKSLALDFVDSVKSDSNLYYIIRDIYGKISIYIIGEACIEDLKALLQKEIGKKWVNTVRTIQKDSPLFGEIQNSIEKISDNVYYGERPLVKRSWSYTARNKFENPTKIISFYSYKGGVGRTTTLALTALQMAREGKKVVVIDFDLEAPGLSTLLRQEKGISYPQYGVVDYLIECDMFETAPDLNEYIYPLTNKTLLGMSGGEVYVMQAANILDYGYENYYEKLSRIDFNMPKFVMENNPVSKMLKAIASQYHPDYIFIDSRAGVHDIGGLALLNYSDEVVALFYGNEQNMLGLNFVLPKLMQADIPFYLINTPIPVLEEAAEEEIGYYLKNSFDIMLKNQYFEDIPDLFDQSSAHYPINISYDVLAANLNSDSRIQQLLIKNDSNNIYKNLASLLMTENSVEVEHDIAKGFDKMEILKSIKDIMKSATASAENEFESYQDLMKNFYPLKEYKYIFDNNKFIITGSKGSGKTALFKVLNCQKYAQALAEYVEIPQNEIRSTEWLIGLNQGAGFPSQANFRAIGKTHNKEYYSVYWKVLALRVLRPVLSNENIKILDYVEEICNCKYSEIIDFIKDHENIDEQLSEFFIEIDRQLKSEDRVIIITYDALDFCIDREYRGDLISELISFWAENNLRFLNLKAKIFLRDDIYKNELHLTDRIKLNNYRTQIQWEYDYLLAMVWKRMLESTPALQSIFRNVLETNGYSLQKSDLVGYIPRPNEDVNKTIIHELIGEKMGRGNKAYTYNWIVYRLSDTNSKIFPRSILKLFSVAAENEISDLESSGKIEAKILKPRSLESAMIPVSEDRVTDMSEEYREYKKIFSDLRNYCNSFPVEDSTLREALENCGLKRENLKTDIDRLIEIGVLKEYQRKKSDPIRYHIPDIYLKGMHLTRKGYK